MKRVFVLLIIIFLIGVAFGTAVFIWWQESLKPLNTEGTGTKIFVIKKGEGLNNIGKNLEEQKLIKNWLAFSLLVRLNNWQNKIQAGDFRLSPSFPAVKIAQELQHGTLDVWVTITEGLRTEEIISLLLKSGIWNEFVSQSPAFKQKLLFLFNQKNGQLFPDTYLIPKESTPEQVLDILLKNFNQKAPNSLWEEAKKQDLTPEQVLILASLVEREAKYENDRPVVAGILLKRLREQIPLQVDATIQYAIGENYIKEGGKSWWKKDLTREDLAFASPYNTYLYKGLPPGPICNPGLSAIKSVIFSQKTPYYYYLSDNSGKLHYAQTIEEHNENIRKYL